MSLVETEQRDGATWLWLDRPARHNALVPQLVNDLRDAIAEAAARKTGVLILSGRGSSFSTGGDLNGFLDHAGSRDELARYSEELVEALHRAILDLLSFPGPVFAAINGPVTGGSAGLMLAADLVAMAEEAYLQPYYSAVGFGPDGGWTALLPERVGTSKALEIQYRNKRLEAREAVALGLAEAACPAASLGAKIEHWISDLARGFAQSHLAARRNVWDERRRESVRERLDQEKKRFLELIGRAETLQALKTFTGSPA